MNNIGNQAIVVAVDGSARSDAALDWAVAEATRRRLPLTLFSAATSQIPGGESLYADAALSDTMAELSSQAADARLEEAAVRVRDVAPGLDVTLERSLDGAAAGLVELSSHADTVVLGRSGHGPLLGAVLGSVALQVVTHAHCPVVIAHPEVDTTGARGVVVGVDGSDTSELALGYAFMQASLRAVPLDVVHAWWSADPTGLTAATAQDQLTQEQLALSESMVGWAEKFPDVEVRTSLPMGPQVLTLTEAATDAELLVVGSRGRGGFRSLLLGSVSQGVLLHAGCTVAVVRARTGATAH